MAAGDVYNGELTLVNYGLIRADDVQVEKTKGLGAADKAAIQQVNEGRSPRKSCRVNCPVRTRSDAGARDR